MGSLDFALDLASHDGPLHVGAIHSPVGGRTDHLPMRVPPNSYVLPADVVSGLPGAEGNTTAGHRILDELFKRGAYGSNKAQAPYGANAIGPYGTQAARAAGGAMAGSGPVPIVAAGGEYVVAPSAVAALGGGDVKHGHAVLDHFVKSVRAKNIKTLRNLPGPVKEK